ncbi:uncharacterized protein FOMMEDRAFT_151537 [Fomitiporia mediterranea MF3/22]|uniref:uncharacterized protein n=1 Tax=Fomitiporia mediterranea (strain MF3/22) TaxID=694068 RepID=UPI0004409969|nr:uncharacterized protein FOMMEDRAFT_151537 [Fomitiporia mediterranea MF3/22]EJD06303.1 hypothetical protein FOMMEDRAFT_151537 [Fomitiporia mediterranea MF3/22]
MMPSAYCVSVLALSAPLIQIRKPLSHGFRLGLEFRQVAFHFGEEKIKRYRHDSQKPYEILHEYLSTMF